MNTQAEIARIAVKYERGAIYHEIINRTFANFGDGVEITQAVEALATEMAIDVRTLLDALDAQAAVIEAAGELIRTASNGTELWVVGDREWEALVRAYGALAKAKAKGAGE